MTESHTPAPKAIEALPELPPHAGYFAPYACVVFTADQMHAYALAALAAAQAEQAKDVLTVADYEATFADHRRLVRELDVLLNGEEGAAKQASLCDIVGQLQAEQVKPMNQCDGCMAGVPAEAPYAGRRPVHRMGGAAGTMVCQAGAYEQPSPPSDRGQAGTPPPVEQERRSGKDRRSAIYSHYPAGLDDRQKERRAAALSPQPPSPDVERQAVIGYVAEDIYSDRESQEWAMLMFSPNATYRIPVYATPPQEAGDADAEDAARWRWMKTQVDSDEAAELERLADAARSPQQEPKA